ncbi:MAG: homoserine O-acetyltransferase MetX [Microbacteriaceae bacterium]
MDWQTSEETVPSAFVTEMSARSLGAPPVTGAWRDGDHPGDRQFAQIGDLPLDSGGIVPRARIAYETWGTPNADMSNAILIIHSLTADSHLAGTAGPGHATDGWWNSVVGDGRAIDTNTWFVVCPNTLGGCQGSTGPSSVTSDGREWGSRFPYLTVRDQTLALTKLAKQIGVTRWAAVIGGSAAGMSALEYAVMRPDDVARVGLLATSAVTSADQISLNAIQMEAIRMDPLFNGGDYYDQDEGPFRGLALARRMAMMSYRAPAEFNDRFDRAWQSEISPLGNGGRFAVESYLDFHGNKFTRRFDANSYIALVEAMNSHDISRDRGSVRDVLATVTASALVVGIDSDRCFPLEQQVSLAEHLPNHLGGRDAFVMSSPFGHDAFLIDGESTGTLLRQLLDS